MIKRGIENKGQLIRNDPVKAFVQRKKNARLARTRQPGDVERDQGTIVLQSSYSEVARSNPTRHVSERLPHRQPNGFSDLMR